MVGTLRSTDAAFTSTDGREASTHFGVGYGCGRAGHPTTAHVHQYVRLGDQAWGNGNWDPSGAWDDRYPTTLVNSRTVSIEHHDNGGRPAGSGKGVVPEAVIAASIALDALLLRGDLGELKAAGIRFRAGTEAAITRELRAIPIDRHHLIDHHYIAGRLKPSCWRPWADDPVGFPQARYPASLAFAPLAGMTEERYAAAMAGTKRKVTLYVDEDVLRAARVRAARTDKRDSEVVEAALRAYLGFEVVASVWARSDLGEDEAMRLAVEETHAVRAQRRAARGS